MERVQILMSTYNGEKYLKEQIESIVEQKNVNVSILVRDDGSTDDTISLLNEYKRIGVLDYYIGENLRPARSFIHLMMNAPECDYYAFCDQDDVWDHGKLEKAVKVLKKETGPALYYHGMSLVDANLNNYGYYFRKEDMANSFKYTCLFGDEIAGCTMVFNKALLTEIKKYNPTFITMHDGWIHRVCLCVGGKILGDDTPLIKYRQHDKNTVGMKNKKIREYIIHLLKKEKRFSLLANEMLKGYRENLDEDKILFLNSLYDYHTIQQKKNILKSALSVNHDIVQLIKLFIKLSAGAF